MSIFTNHKTMKLTTEEIRLLAVLLGEFDKNELTHQENDLIKRIVNHTEL